MLNLLKDVFSSLQQHKVRYIVIGGIAAVLHGVPRATFDLDILIDADPENAKKLLDALLRSKWDRTMTTAERVAFHRKSQIFRATVALTCKHRRRV